MKKNYKISKQDKQLLCDMGYADEVYATELIEKLCKQTLLKEKLSNEILDKIDEITKLRVRLAELEAKSKSIVETE